MLQEAGAGVAAVVAVAVAVVVVVVVAAAVGVLVAVAVQVAVVAAVEGRVVVGAAGAVRAQMRPAQEVVVAAAVVVVAVVVVVAASSPSCHENFHNMNNSEQNEVVRVGFTWHVALYVALALGVVAALSFFFFGERLFPNSQQPELTERVQERFGELDEYLASAETKKEEAQVRRLIAENRMLVSAEAAHRGLRGIVLDDSLPAAERSLAVQMIGETYFDRSDNSPGYAQRYVFVRKPYENWIDASTEDESMRVWDGMRQLYEYALTFAESPVSHYRIALWYATRGEREKAEGQYFLGNQAYLAFVRALAPQDRQMDGTALWLKGVVASELGRRSEDSVLIAESHKTFDDARGYLRRMQQEGDNYPAFTTELLWADLRYAAALVREGQAENDSFIDELLDEVLEYREYAASRGVGRYLSMLGTSTPTVPFYAEEKQAITELASRHSEFAQMLRDFGWNL